MIASYDHESLWLKAKLFIGRAMDENPERSFDEQALWASLALELMAKAALARVSPLLIATPTEDGRNLLIASGLVDGEGIFNTVTAKTLYQRCEWAFRPFSAQEALRISRGRNEYLHGGGVGFVVPPEAWWPRFWGQASILVHALDRPIHDLVGVDRVEVVETHLAQNKRNLEQRYEMLVARAKQRLAQYESGALPAKLAEEWARQGDLTLGLMYQASHDCPVCGEFGVLEGDYVLSSDPHYEQVGEDDFDVWIDLMVATSHFSCESCRLLLNDLELIEMAGLPIEFEATGDMEDFYEPDYGND